MEWPNWKLVYKKWRQYEKIAHKALTKEDRKSFDEAMKKCDFILKSFFLQLNAKFRKELLKRDNHHCIACSSTTRLQLAHLIPLPRKELEYAIMFKDAKEVQHYLELYEKFYYQPYNLVMLCSNCHVAFHVSWSQNPKWKLHLEVKKKIRQHLEKLYGKDYQKILVANWSQMKWVGIKRAKRMVREALY